MHCESAPSSTRDVHVAHIEIRIDSQSVTPLEELRSSWQSYLAGCSTTTVDEETFHQAPEALCYGGSYRIEVPNHEPLMSIRISDMYQIVTHVFVLSEEETAVEELEPAEGDQEWTAACENWTLPHANLELWESLIFDGTVKQDLLNFATSALLFADKKVSSNLVQLNRMLVCFVSDHSVGCIVVVACSEFYFSLNSYIEQLTRTHSYL